jgi:HAD superfamily phosphoserine phosphatase-like hydrolase
MITVIIPVLNESPTIGQIVKFAFQTPEVTEVIVVDDGSIDGTPEKAAAEGARVITSTLLGKGASMSDGIWAASNEILVFLDGDLSSLDPQLIPRLTALLRTDEADFVKARFSRNSGRVTTLTARPLLQTFFPELNDIDQPLGGIISGRRSLFRKITLETDYGVDVGLLLDVHFAEARIAQADIGRIEHDSQHLDALADMARQVTRTILNRAALYNRLDLRHIQEVEEVERSTEMELSSVLARVGQPARLALFDMDGTLLKGRFVEALARRVNRTQEIAEFLDNPTLSDYHRASKIAALFGEIEKRTFEDVASAMPLMTGAREIILALRAKGYRVGIISDSYHVATEIVRRRVFADFSIAHQMQFRNGVSTGRVRQCSAMRHPDGCRQHEVCKLNALLHMSRQLAIPSSEILAVGDGLPDCCMFHGSGISFAFEPRSPEVAAAATHVIREDLRNIEDFLCRAA